MARDPVVSRGVVQILSREVGAFMLRVLSGGSMRWLRLVLAVALAALPPLSAVASNSCIWSLIDHKWTKDTSGIWNPSIYRGVVHGLTVAQIGAALWEGVGSRLGRTAWQGIDSQVFAVGSSEVMKRVLTRVRPSETDDPCLFFAHDSNHSFPSGEAAGAAALVAPYIFEYGSEHPGAYGLLALPIYVGLARIKNQEHWQSDVLAGWALGGAWGWYAHQRETPLFVQILPRGLSVGIKTRF